MQSYADLIHRAQERLAPILPRTPVLTSASINAMVGGHQLFFKAEMLQKTGAFKARGAYNTLLWAQEQQLLTPTVVAVSSGNHGQAVAWAASRLGVAAHIFMAKNCSPVKIAATRGYGAQVTLADDRLSAEALARTYVQTHQCLFVPPYDHDQIIAGQGTACLEAWQDYGPFDAVFTPCGGAGLLSGSIVAAKTQIPECEVFGAEPTTANDAAQSLRQGKIFRFSESPATICDGVRTLGLAERTFHILREHCAGIFEISDEVAVAWARKLMHYLKVQTEPTSALAMAAAELWLQKQTTSKRCLVILSGGNMDASTLKQIYSE